MPRRTKGGNVIKPFSLRQEQWDALRRLAFQRAMDAGSTRPDLSALVREALDLWLAKQKPPKS